MRLLLQAVSVIVQLAVRQLLVVVLALPVVEELPPGAARRKSSVGATDWGTGAPENGCGGGATAGARPIRTWSGTIAISLCIKSDAAAFVGGCCTGGGGMDHRDCHGMC